MITPPYLKNGSRIGVVAPARFVRVQELEPAIQLIESWGVEVVRGAHLYARHHQFAGTDEQRAEDLQAMLDNEEIDAILFARGGYGTIRILDRLDFRRFCSHPKWIAGFSDITALLSHIESQFQIETIHGPMMLGFEDSPENIRSMESLRKALFGEPLHYEVETGLHSRFGLAQAPVAGGNLSLIYALAGTISEPDLKGKILFIEDLDEYYYHIDRMMHQLKRAGKLQNLAALVVGGLTQMRDNQVPYGKTAEEIILESVQEYDFPVLTGFPSGHEKINLSLILGRTASLEVGEKTSRLLFQHKSEGAGNQLKGWKFAKSVVVILALFALIYTLFYFVFKILIK